MKHFAQKDLRRLILASMLLAIGYILPFFTGQIPGIGKMLLPMHFPIFICGMVCGPHYGLSVGIILPIIRSIIVTMPPLYPNAVAMAIELGVYGLTAGILYMLIKKKNIFTVYVSLISAMLLGRAVSGIAKMFLYATPESPYTWKMFIAGAFTEAIPGIILQLILIPAIMTAIQYASKKTGRT